MLVRAIGTLSKSGFPRALPPLARRGVSRTQAFERSMEAITFGNNLPGYICGTNVASPAVIVIQEWWGITDVIKAHALKISEQGYRCLVPDLYKGKIGVDKEEAQHLFDHLDWPQAVDEIKQAAQYLRDTGATKVGAIGFCMGGALALSAAQQAGVDCGVAFYGLPSPAICQPENVKAPVALHFGRLDEYKGFSDPESAQAFADKVNAAGGKAELYIYEDAGHGFLNEGPEGIAKREHMGFPHPPPSTQQLAYQRVFDFFDAHLKH